MGIQKMARTRAGMAPDERGVPWQARQIPWAFRKWPGAHFVQRKEVYPGAQGEDLAHVSVHMRVVALHEVEHAVGGQADGTGHDARRMGGGSVEP